MIEAVIFDVDGVLVDSYAAHFESWKRLGRETGVTLTEEQFAESFGRRSREVIRQHWASKKVSDTSISISAGGNGSKGTRSITEAEVARLDRRKEKLFREILEKDFPGMDGARELIEALAAQGMRIAVGSSAPEENVSLVLDRLGIRELVQARVTGEDVQRGKPDPQVFLLAAERLGVSPDRCVVIEDAVPGIEAARSAGMKAVALVSTGRDAGTLRAAGPERVVRSLRELTAAALRGL
ncbi:MAG TPA: HAD family phosphatase [Candidatus Polarisedimenticolaceae bacterium]|nr:HAD family phosphatase [Candidatus Polarisedimenticolaceae bacterium]